LTHYREGWGGSHEFQTGVFLQPRNKRDGFWRYSNFAGDGWYQEDHRLIDPDNPSLGTVPFMRERSDVGSLQFRSNRDRDIGLYFQDAWKPTPRLTLNLGLRVDFVHRYDALIDFTRMDTIVVGPRAGFSFLVTEDARNVLRGSIGRHHEAVNSRDAASSFSGATVDETIFTQYDSNGDGIWENELVERPTAGAIDPSIQFDPDLTQPHVDEYILGFRKQFPGLVAVDTALIHRRNGSIYALRDVNGIYPDGSYQPFVGFGLVDPDYGIINQQTNNTWTKLIYTALEITVMKRLSHNFQAMAGFNKQGHHLSGTWNPTDPARFIQPEPLCQRQSDVDAAGQPR
jgi:outer membrane receptor protein involved in Fe transport